MPAIRSIFRKIFFDRRDKKQPHPCTPCFRQRTREDLSRCVGFAEIGRGLVGGLCEAQSDVLRQFVPLCPAHVFAFSVFEP